MHVRNGERVVDLVRASCDAPPQSCRLRFLTDSLCRCTLVFVFESFTGRGRPGRDRGARERGDCEPDPAGRRAPSVRHGNEPQVCPLHPRAAGAGGRRHLSMRRLETPFPRSFWGAGRAWHEEVEAYQYCTPGTFFAHMYATSHRTMIVTQYNLDTW